MSRRHILASKLYATLTFISLGGIYLMPERIKIFVAVFLLGLGIYFVVSNASVKLNKASIGLTVYLLVGVLSNLANENVEFDVVFNFVISLIIAILVMSVEVDKYTAVCLKRAFVCVFLLVVVGCLLQLFFPQLLLKINKLTLGKEKYDIFYNSFFVFNFVVGFSYQTGVTGYYLAILEGYLLSLIFAYMYTNKTITKIVYIIAFGAVFVLLFLTAKRLSLGIIILAFLIMLYIYERNNPLKVIIIVFILSIAGIILLQTTEIGQRLVARTLGDNPTSGRSEIYSWLTDYFKQKPIFGHGFGSTVTYIKKYTNGHNIYLQSLMETGIVGFIAFMYAIITHILISVRSLKNIKQKAICDRIICGFYAFMVLNFVVSGMLGNPLYDVYTLFGYAIAVSVLQAMPNRIKQQRLVGANNYGN